jgi:hypothetical protein
MNFENTGLLFTSKIATSNFSCSGLGLAPSSTAADLNSPIVTVPFFRKQFVCHKPFLSVLSQTIFVAIKFPKSLQH